VRLYLASRCIPRPGVLPGLGAAVGVAPVGRCDAARVALARLVRRSLWRPGLACGGGPKRGLHSPGLGRSRGGLTSRIHLACDVYGRPLAFTVTSGNTNGRTQFTTVKEAIRVPRPGPGRPQVRPAHAHYNDQAGHPSRQPPLRY